MLNNISSKVEEFSRVNWARKRAIIEIFAIRVFPPLSDTVCVRNVSPAQKRRFSTRQACSRWLVGEEHERLVCSSASSITFTLKPVFYANRLAKNRFPPICIAPMPYLKRKYPWNRHKNTFRINVDLVRSIDFSLVTCSIPSDAIFRTIVPRKLRLTDWL